MRIDINPRSLLNLEHICEVLYKLHPSVLDYLVEMERSLGNVLGTIQLNNVSNEERDFLSNFMGNSDDKKVYSSERYKHLIFEELLKTKDLSNLTEQDKMELALSTRRNKYNSYVFRNLRKYIQLDTDEYIPIKIFIEVEDPVIGKKVKELIRALEKTRAPEQFYWNKKEIDEDAYFAEGYNLKMDDEQKKKFNKFLWGEDIESLKKLLKKEKLYP